MSVTVYGKPGVCNASPHIAPWTKLESPTPVVDITENPDARDYVMALGYLSAPVVLTGAGEHFGGFRPDRIREIPAA